MSRKPLTGPHRVGPFVHPRQPVRSGQPQLLTWTAGLVTVEKVSVLSLDDVLADVLRQNGSGTGIRLGATGPGPTSG